MEGGLAVALMLVMGIAVWAIADLAQYGASDFERVGISKATIFLIVFASGGSLGFLLYLSHYRPALRRARLARLASAEEQAIA